MSAWGLDVLGTRNPSAKLNPVKVRLARRLRSGEGFPVDEIAALFGVSAQAIYSILSGRTWWHVTSDRRLDDY